MTSCTFRRPAVLLVILIISRLVVRGPPHLEPARACLPPVLCDRPGAGHDGPGLQCVRQEARQHGA